MVPRSVFSKQQVFIAIRQIAIFISFIALKYFLCEFSYIIWAAQTMAVVLARSTHAEYGFYVAGSNKQ